MNDLIVHRGPDGDGTWVHDHEVAASRTGGWRSSTSTTRRPADDRRRRQLDHLQRRDLQLPRAARASSAATASAPSSDTEVDPARLPTVGRRLRSTACAACSPSRSGTRRRRQLFCARDRFGIKPLLLRAVVGDVLYFASEAKALLPFLPRDRDRPRRASRTTWPSSSAWPARRCSRASASCCPATACASRNGTRRDAALLGGLLRASTSTTRRATSRSASQELLDESVALHLRSDVPVGAYLSGGLDSSIVASLAASAHGPGMMALHRPLRRGRRATTRAATRAALADERGFELHEVDIGADDFVEHDRARSSTTSTTRSPGPGSFPQYMVSEARRAAPQGGPRRPGRRRDLRRLRALPDRLLRAVHQGARSTARCTAATSSSPTSRSSRTWRAARATSRCCRSSGATGLFEDLDARYFRLINRAPRPRRRGRLDALGDYSPFETFREIFHGDNVGKESYFDRMTHFDFKTLLPALLQVEDRVSMAHGLESRVPLLDHRARRAGGHDAGRRQVQGRPHEARAQARRSRRCVPDVDRRAQGQDGLPGAAAGVDRRGPGARFRRRHVLVAARRASASWSTTARCSPSSSREPRFGRKIWGLLSLELWQQRFHDRAADVQAHC